MAFSGPSYGLSRECAMKSQAKFSLERAIESLAWIESVIEQDLVTSSEGIQSPIDFQTILKDGTVLCKLINKIRPGSVKKINTLNAPFKQRENIEMYLKGCVEFGLKTQDLFQVNDLYEAKNIYMIVDNLYSLGGEVQRQKIDCPSLGVKISSANKRDFDERKLNAGQSVIGLQYGSNKGASQAGMTAYGTGRQIRPDENGLSR